MQSGNDRRDARFVPPAGACEVLAAGGAVVVPNPPPMAYGIVATRACTVNNVKGRPPDQNVAVSLHDVSEWRRVAACVDVPRRALRPAADLLARRLSVLLPLRADTACPEWCRPAVRDGRLAAFNGSWTLTAAVWARFPRLFGSSANRTGEPPALTAAAAGAALGRSGAVVVDGDADMDPLRPPVGSTVVCLDRDGRLGLHRSGAQDRAWSSRPEAYVEWLSALVGLPTVGPRVASPTGARSGVVRPSPVRPSVVRRSVVGSFGLPGRGDVVAAVTWVPPDERDQP